MIGVSILPSVHKICITYSHFATLTCSLDLDIARLVLVFFYFVCFACMDACLLWVQMYKFVKFTYRRTFFWSICLFCSPNGTRTGQNLGAIVGNNSTITKVVELFYKEKSDYDFNNHQWKGVVGHYLQV